MRLLLVLMLLGGLAACVTPGAQVKALKASRIGIINNLPADAGDLYVGVTVFENELLQKQVDWDFPGLVSDELARQITARGATAVDLTAVPEVEDFRHDWFEVGYTLDLGLGKHALPDDREELLAGLMAKHNLDLVLLLLHSDYNEDVPYDEAHPIGAFGLFERPSLFGAPRIFTYVQIDARAIAGSPPAVLEDLNGSNLRRVTENARQADVHSPRFRPEVTEQAKQAVSMIVAQLGL